jgi:hypothetical protein
MIDIKAFQSYEVEKKELQTKNEFTSDYDKNKVMDVNSLIKKRPRPDDMNQDNENKDLNSKRDKINDEK